MREGRRQKQGWNYASWDGFPSRGSYGGYAFQNMPPPTETQGYHMHHNLPKGLIIGVVASLGCITV